MDIATGLAAAKAALEATKAALDLLKRDKVDKQEVTSRVMEMQEMVLRTREALGDALEENRNLREQIAKHDRLKELEADMDYVEDGGFYVKKSEKAAGKNIAYCPLCFKAAHADVPLNPQSGRGHFYCEIHKAGFETAAYRDNAPGAVKKRRFRPGGPWS